jgi:hypothetical protein
MGNSDNLTNQKNSGGLIKILFIRAPKDNHNELEILVGWNKYPE